MKSFYEVGNYYIEADSLSEMSGVLKELKINIRPLHYRKMKNSEVKRLGSRDDVEWVR